ncbi:MAG: hypothetical protein ACXVA9_07710 [Bdellovibrionales bacterium]
MNVKQAPLAIWLFFGSLILGFAQVSHASNPVDHVTCIAAQDTDPVQIKNLLSTTLKNTFSASQYALVKYLCRLDSTAPVSPLDVDMSYNFKNACSTTSTTLCLQAQSPSFAGKTALTLTKKSSATVYALFRNPDRRMTYTVNANTFGLKIASLDKNTDVNFDATDPNDLSGLSAGINLGGEVKSSSCQVYVSGATGLYPSAICSGPGCTPAGTVPVNNGKLIFQTGVLGTSGDLTVPQKITWSGGPNAQGVWASAPVNKTLIVRASVVTQDGVTNECALQFTQLGKGYNLRVNKYGDCPYFKASRDYYYLNSSNSGPQSTGYSNPLQLPGFDVTYGQNAPDVPFRGILNAGMDNTGAITISSGHLVLPAADKRRYSSAVVVGLSIDPATRVVGLPVYYGTMDPENYGNTLLRLVGNEPADNSLVVFQFFLAHPEVVGGIDTRGTTGTPYYKFTEASGGQPYDRLVPVVNDSCMPVFQIRTPARADKAMPAVLKDATTCAFSKPFKAGDVKAGRASVSVIHFSPEGTGDTYPLDLVKGDSVTSQSASTSTSASGPQQCWVIYPNFGSASWTSGASPPTPPADECSMSSKAVGTMGYRYSMEAMRWGLGFSNQVKATGVGKTISRDQAQIDGGGTWGMLIVAFFGNANNLTTSSTLSTGPSNKVRVQNFAVRQWGQEVADVTRDQTGQMGEADNLVTAFSAPICPGSQFQYDNVSLSWSPLILDTEGHGIKISRVFPRSVGFDITGTNFKSYVDWPENTKDVAFLVLPDKKGKVNSIAQLFGYQKGYENGFEKLRSFDKNHDGRIDKDDKIYKKLRLWYDRNRDGIAQNDELVPLATKGVTMISLKYGRPGRDDSAEQKTLAGLYYNQEKKAMMNIEDHYFYEYIDKQRVKIEKNNGRSVAGVK